MKAFVLKNPRWKTAADCFVLLLCLIFGEQLLFNSSVIAVSIRQSLILCVDTLIPSLFCFMVLTSFLSATGLGKLLSLPLLPLTRFLCLPAESGSILLMSLLGGYPVGIKALSDAYRSHTLDEAQLKRLALFCICPAPSFVIVAVGGRLLGNAAAGVLIYVAQVLAVLFLALLTSVPALGQSKQELCRFLRRSSGTSYSSALVEAVVFSSQTLLSMCGYVLLFSCFTALLDELALNATASALLSAVLEVTGGSVRLAAHSLPHKLSIFAFFLSFGGLSVLFQLKSILGDLPCSMGRLLVGRISHGLCSAVFTAILVQCFPQALEVFGSSSSPVPLADPSTPLLTGCLIGMMIILLGSFERVLKNK